MGIRDDVRVGRDSAGRPRASHQQCRDLRQGVRYDLAPRHRDCPHRPRRRRRSRCWGVAQPWTASSQSSLDWSTGLSTDFVAQWSGGTTPSTTRSLRLTRSHCLATLALVDHHTKAALKWEAGHDSLTALANRSGFRRVMGDADDRSAVLFVDLDGFKDVNDEFGPDERPTRIRRADQALYQAKTAGKGRAAMHGVC